MIAGRYLGNMCIAATAMDMTVADFERIRVNMIGYPSITFY